ncbi:MULTISPECIES: hypothetical protein [unclassified Streptomyces]|uniref:hypothetical protein n=1 Tax=unclassified Streptomyces TaxID=2593676 RepID=UPI000A7288FD|nr:hypothetical protein [Streptomyces sp. BvitLS-983]
MPAASTPDPAPADTAQRNAAEPSKVTGALLVPSVEGCGSSENVALDELSDAGLAAPVDGTGLAMDRSDLDHGTFSLLDDAVLHSGRLADVVDTAAFWSGVSGSFQPLIGLSTMLSEFTSRANFSLAPALAGIELAVRRSGGSTADDAGALALAAFDVGPHRWPYGRPLRRGPVRRRLGEAKPTGS